MQELNTQKGQTLIEMLIALSIVVISILGILTLVNRSLGINRVASEHYTATYLAAEGIELTKNLIDKSFLEATSGTLKFYLPNFSGKVYLIDYDDKLTDLVPISGAGCALSEPKESEVRTLFEKCDSLKSRPLRFDGNKGLYSYGTGDNTKFKRVIIIDKVLVNEQRPSGSDLEYRVTSAVGWESRGGKYTVQLEDHFLPWRIP